MILCLGPFGSGKTTLLKKLTESASKELECLPVVVSTVGTNIVNVTVGKNVTKTIHELGGSMAPIWKSHFSGCSAIIFVIDGSNLQQVSCACIQLLETMTDPALNGVPVLLVLNKLDIETSTSVLEMRNILNIEAIQYFSNQAVTIIETSCVTKQDLNMIRDWLAEHGNTS